MVSYHVYFSANKEFSESEVTEILRQFIEHEKTHNLMREARVLKMTNKASFSDLPDYHFVADYASEADQQTAMKEMQKRYREEPHASLMRMVSEFRVAFSKEIF